jgi:hypothetical protein
MPFIYETKTEVEKAGEVVARDAYWDKVKRAADGIRAKTKGFSRRDKSEYADEQLQDSLVYYREAVEVIRFSENDDYGFVNGLIDLGACTNANDAYMRIAEWAYYGDVQNELGDWLDQDDDEPDDDEDRDQQDDNDQNDETVGRG